MFLTTVLGIFFICIGAAIIYYYYKRNRHLGYEEQTSFHGVEGGSSNVRELHEAQQVINYVKNRRESVGRRSSFEVASEEFVNLKNVKLSRALSCDSVTSETSEADFSGQGEIFGSGQNKIEIPDIKAWLKNPTDFIRLPEERRGSLSGNNNNNNDPSDPNREDIVVDSIGSPHRNDDEPSILISMSYLPTAERLSVVIVRVRLPVKPGNPIPKVIYVKAYLVDDETGKRTCKKKTSLKTVDPVSSTATSFIVIPFNELMIFKLPINQLNRTGVRISITGIFGILSDTAVSMNGQESGPSTAAKSENKSLTSLGSILISSTSPSTSGVTHFTSMSTTMRKPITMWHNLKQKW